MTACCKLRKIKKEVIAVMHPDTTAMQEVTKHVTECVKYPATKQTILEACDKMAHVPDSGQRLLRDNLPNRVFTSAEDVLSTVPM